MIRSKRAQKDEIAYAVTARRRAIRSVRPLYGWWIVGACVVGLVVCYSTFVAYQFGLSILPLQAEFGCLRTEIKGAFVLGSFLLVAAATLAAIVLDRFGERMTLLLLVAAFALIVAAMGIMSEQILSFYILFVLLRFAAAGTLPATFTRFVVAWFDRRRGLALGITGLLLMAAISGRVVAYAIGLWTLFGAFLISSVSFRLLGPLIVQEHAI